MTQTLYDSLQGLNSEVITVGTLLGTGDFADGGNTNDEEDLFQCGKCKKQFFSLLAFMAHKKTHQLNDFQSSQKLLTETAAADEPHPVALLQPDDDDRLQLQPIILSESDILSFSIGQSGLSLSSSEQVLNGFEDSEALLMPEEEDSQLKDSSDMAPNLQFRSAQIILTTQISKDQPIQMVLPNVPGQDTEPSYSLDSHILTLGEPSMLEQCTEDEGENQELESAVKSHEGKPKLNCLYCGKEFTKNFDLQQHMRCHTGERPFQCVVCGRSFTQKSNVKKHMRTHKVWPQKIRTLPEKPLEKMTTDSASQEVVVNDLFVCQYCPATFSSFTQLKSHRKTHADSKIFRCIQTKCGQTFESLQEFLQHTASHQSQDDVEYRCCVCRLAFNNLDELGTHQNTHPLPIRNKQGPFSCKVCKSKFATVEAYDRHQTEDTHFYPCPECSKTYVSERHLRRHLNTHSSYSTHLCPDCGKTFKTAQNLNLHKLIHTGERSYKCKMCSASFVRQDRLMRHMMMHDPSHRFKCPFNKSLGCKKEFYRKDKLKQHLLSHTSKHLKCKGCPRMFKQKLQLTRHEAVCVGENKPCKDCGHVTASLDRYKKSSVKGKEETHVNRLPPKMFKENSSTMISKENTSIKDSQSDNRSSNTETMTTKELHINKNTSKTHVQSSDIYSLDNVLKNNTIELEDLMKSLDKLDSVLAQIESVKKTRIELLYQTKKLQQNIKLNEEEPVSVEERAKRQQSTSLLKKRENVIKGLENMEILLSQTLLVTINNWAETLESKLKYHEKEKSLSPEIVELYEKDTSKTGV